MNKLKSHAYGIIFLTLTGLVGCGSKDSSSTSTAAEETTGTCTATTNTHTGCCSSHGGITGICATGKVCYTASGRLVCADGTISPSCVKTTKPTDEIPYLFEEYSSMSDEIQTMAVVCQQ